MPEKLTAREGRIFAFTLAAGFLFVALVLRARELGTAATVATYVAAAAFVAGILIPSQLGPARRLWMQFGELIGTVTTPIIMGLLYYLLFTPFGLVRRQLAKRKPTATPPSFWIQRSPPTGPERMERQF